MKRATEAFAEDRAEGIADTVHIGIERQCPGDRASSAGDDSGSW